MNDLILYTVLGRETLAALGCPRVELVLDHETMPPTDWRGWATAVHAHELLPGRTKHSSNGHDYANLAALDDTLCHRSLDMARRSLRVALDLGAHVLVIHQGKTRAPASPGDYARFVDAVALLADEAGGNGLTICVENMPSSWGYSFQEWQRLPDGVGRPNVALCLDTSHAAQTARCLAKTPAEREALLWAHLDADIRHVHWSDDHLVDGHGDHLHLSLGRGSLPRDFHQAVARLPATKSLEIVPLLRTGDAALARANLEMAERLKQRPDDPRRAK